MKKYFLLVLIVMFLVTACSKGSKDSSGDDRVESPESSVKQDNTDYKVKAERDVTDDVAFISCYEYPVKESVVLWGKPAVGKKTEPDKKKSEELKDKLSGLHWEDRNSLKKIQVEMTGINIKDWDEQRKNTDIGEWSDTESIVTYYLNGELWYDLELSFSSDETYYVSLGSGVIQKVVNGGTYYISVLTKEIWDYFYSLDPERTEGLEFDEEGYLSDKGCEQYAKTVLTKIIAGSSDFGKWLNINDGEEFEPQIKVENGNAGNLAYIYVYKDNSSDNTSGGILFRINTKKISVYTADKYEEAVLD